MAEKRRGKEVKTHAVYLLVCLNEKFKGRVYVGYTVEPERRAKQHNAGVRGGGAKRTSGKGPWQTALFVSGFPSEASALRFEWTLQHPTASRRLKDLVRRRMRDESSLQYHIYLVETALNVGPWLRLPLSVHWLLDYEPFITTPHHMPVVKTSSIVIPPRVSNTTNICFLEETSFCSYKNSRNGTISCTTEDCNATWHLLCLAKYMLMGDNSLNHVVPIQCLCPICLRTIVWGNVIKANSILV